MNKNYSTISVIVFFLLTVATGWTLEPPPAFEPLKWQQRPDMEQGINVESNPGQDKTVSDDWLCLDGSPVSDLHFWGSYLGWHITDSTPLDVPPGIDKFRIRIYSDAPAIGPDSFSRPDKLLYEVWVDDFKETFEASIPVTWPAEAEFEHKYRYNLDLPRLFWQKRGRIYWINISAVPRNPDFPWAWESAMDRWNDVSFSGDYIDPDNWFWNLIKNPMTDEFVDMSFELTTCGGPIKWLQFPDMSKGTNIPSFPNDDVVADDWVCTDGKPITEIHFWGTYLSPDGRKHWEEGNSGPPWSVLPDLPGVTSFKLSFHEDVPAGIDLNMTWSHPGKLIRELVIEYKDIKERYWGSIPHTRDADEIWWEHKFYYIVRLKDPFEQKQGTVYWLDIGAVPAPESNWYWGWETSGNHWNDSAVQGGGVRRLTLEENGSSVDMAFLLITEEETPYCKGDFDRDGDVDGMDLVLFVQDLGWADCYYRGDCEGDMDYDGDVDTDDFVVFAADFGRSDCPCGLKKKLVQTP